MAARRLSISCAPEPADTTLRGGRLIKSNGFKKPCSLSETGSGGGGVRCLEDDFSSGRRHLVNRAGGEIEAENNHRDQEPAAEGFRLHPRAHRLADEHT